MTSSRTSAAGSKGAAKEPSRPAELWAAAVAVAGLSFGVSSFAFFGFYDLGVFGPLTLVWLAVLLALLIAAPGFPGPAALAAAWVA